MGKSIVSPALAEKVKELNGKMTTTSTVSCSKDSSMTIANGGVYRYGQVVFISLRYSVSTSGGHTLLSGLPTPVGNTGSGNYVIGCSNDSQTYLITPTGDLFVSSLASGTTYICTVVYLTND